MYQDLGSTPGPIALLGTETPQMRCCFNSRPPAISNENKRVSRLNYCFGPCTKSFSINEVLSSKFEDAAAFYEQSIEVVENGDSEKNQKALARSYGSFGWMYMNQGKVDDALRLINRSLEIVTPLAKKEHAQISLKYKVMTDQLNLAAINLQRLKDYEKAIKHAKLGIEIGEKIATNSSQDPKTKAVLARCYMVKGLAQGKNQQPGKSIDSFEDALAISTKLVKNGNASPDSKYTHCMVCSFLAEAKMRSGDRDRAEELNRKALDTFNALVKAHPQVTDYKNGVIEQSRALCSLLGICEESTRVFENTLRTYRGYLKAVSRMTQGTESGLRSDWVFQMTKQIQNCLC